MPLFTIRHSVIKKIKISDFLSVKKGFFELYPPPLEIQ